MFDLFAKVSLSKIGQKFRRIQKGIDASIKGTSNFALDVALKHTLQRFEAAGANRRAQEAPNGYRWPPPRPATLESRKVNRSGSKQALVDTGLMRDSIRVKKRKRGRNDADIITYIQPGRYYQKPNNKKIAVSTVARLQQKGFITAGGAYVPPRPFSGVDPDTEKVITGNLITRLKASLFGLG